VASCPGAEDLRIRRLKMKRIEKSWLAGAIALSVALGGGAIAYASIPDSGGVIHGCYQMNVGNLRVIDSATESCRPSEVPLNWSQTGPQGAQGPAGPQGAQGPQGPTGPSGLSHAYTSTGSTISTVAAVLGPVPAGNFVISATAEVYFDPCPLCIGPPHADCEIFDTFSPRDLYFDAGNLEGANDLLVVPFTEWMTTATSGDTLTLYCSADRQAVTQGTITAIQVDSFN
jgi:hypothetical protein